MRLKGSSLIEIVIAMMLWSSFLYLFQAHQVQALYERQMYEKTLNHYHIIEQVYVLKTLNLIEFETYVFNNYGQLDSLGLYTLYVFGDAFTIHYEGTIIYDSTKD